MRRSLPHLAFIRFHVVDVASNAVTAQRVVPVGRLRPGVDDIKLFLSVILSLTLKFVSGMFSICK